MTKRKHTATKRKLSGLVTRRDEKGSATMLVLVLVAVLTTMSVAAVAVGGVLVGHRRAASAADLAALAAAEALSPAGASAVTGSTACDEAGRVAEANDAKLAGCLVEGVEAVVEVKVDVPTVFGANLSVPGRARAGPSTVGSSNPVGDPVQDPGAEIGPDAAAEIGPDAAAEIGPDMATAVSGRVSGSGGPGR